MMKELLFVVLSFFNVCHGQSGTSLVLIGGGLDDKNEVWDVIIDKAGGADAARIGVISSASADPPDSASYYVDLLLGKGVAEAVYIPIHEGNTDANEDPDVIADINRMTGYFFSGGDQARVINSFYHNPHSGNRTASSALLALHERFASGAVISGSSAGAVSHGKPVMMMGGYSWEALQYGCYEWDDPDMPRWTVEYDARGGLGFLDGYIVDSHYSERGREGRLTRLVADSRAMGIRGTNFGIGLDEDTAIVITDANTEAERGEVVGTFGVMIQDLRGITEDSHNGEYRIRNILAHYLTEGDVIHFNSMEITYPEWKPTLTGRESNSNAPISDDIFDGNRNSKVPEFVRTSTGLFDSQDFKTYGDTYENNPDYQVWFDRSVDERAEAFEGRAPSDNQPRISYQYLHIDMYAQ